MDAALAECVLSLVEDAEKTLAECARVLKVRGHLAISDMCARNPDAIAGLRALAGTCVSGMLVRAELEAALARQGFAIELWEDHSDMLKQLVARFVMAHGRVEQLWACKADAQESQRVNQAMKDVRPGYFLLVAKKLADKANGGRQ